MTVDVSRTKTTSIKIQSEIRIFLFAHGFKDLGAGGYDAIKGGRTSFIFEDSNRIVVIFGAENIDYIWIRLSQDKAELSPYANQLFNELAHYLNAHWPGAVTQEANAFPRD